MPWFIAKWWLLIQVALYGKGKVTTDFEGHKVEAEAYFTPENYRPSRNWFADFFANIW